MDLPTRFLTLRFLRLVTVLVFAPLRLANDYYDKVLYLCLILRKGLVLVPVPICLKKNNGYSDIVLPEVIFNIPIVIRPARAIPKRTISDSID